MSNVYWNPETGATCPACGAERAKVTSSPRWEDGLKLRYHKCECGEAFQSIQFSTESKRLEVERRLSEMEQSIRKLDEQREKLNRILNYA